MDTQALNTAKAAYQTGDWASAASALAQVKAPGEVCGEADHLRGNALMKLGKYAEAAQAYSEALQDTAYGHVGALSCNCGRALVAAGNSDQAVAYFQNALNDSSYATPYKAHLALGNIYSRNGMPREAGVAWRNAAIDETNPDPSGALSKLGGSFMQLGRPSDAIEAYRTALDFSNGSSQGAIYGDLGLAYMASNRVAEAADAFSRANSDPSYTLTSEQQASYTAAQKALYRVSTSATPSDTDQMLASAGYGPGGQGGTGSYDPLDPLGKSGEFIPSPEDTGFFSVTEEDLMKADKADRKAKRKHNHRGLKVFLFLLILVIVLAAAGGFAYYKGYGWPTQEAVVTDMFNAASEGNDISSYLADSVSDDAKTQIEAILHSNSGVSISGVDRTMTSSTVLASATLASGGSQDYEVTLGRKGLSWEVTAVDLTFASTMSENVTAETVAASTEATVSAETTDSAESTDATDTGDTSADADASADASAEGTEATE